MNKVEFNPITIIIGAVTLLIVGITIGAVAVGQYLKKELKRLIKMLRDAHKDDLNSEKDKFNQELSKKDELLKQKDRIIEELLNLLQKKDDNGRSLIDTTLGLKTFNIITTQRKRLNDWHDSVG